MAALALPASAAQARAADGFLGAVLPFTTRCEDVDRGVNCLSNVDLDRMQKAHVRVVRWGLRWSRVQPLRLLPPNWRAADGVIGSLASRGIRVLPVLGGTPRWVEKSSETPPLDSRTARDGWRKFVAAAVRRYGPGGEYWTSRFQQQFPGRSALPITTWQVWNEPNLAHTFPPRPSAWGYARLLRITDQAVGDQDPRAKVLLGGMPGYVGHHAWGYLDHLYRRPGIKRRFDAVALHPYAPDLRHVMLQIKRVRQVMRANGDGGSDIWITELGWGLRCA